MVESLACGVVRAAWHEELQRVKGDGIGDPRPNQAAEVPEQSRPGGTDLVAILGILRIGLQPKGLSSHRRAPLGSLRTQSPNRGSLKNVA